MGACIIELDKFGYGFANELEREYMTHIQESLCNKKCKSSRVGGRQNESVSRAIVEDKNYQGIEGTGLEMVGHLLAPFSGERDEIGITFPAMSLSLLLSSKTFPKLHPLLVTNVSPMSTQRIQYLELCCLHILIER